MISCFNGCDERVKYDGFIFKRELIYWVIECRRPISRAQKCSFIGENGSIRNMSLKPPGIADRNAIVFRGREGWDDSKPALTNLSSAWPHQMYRGFILSTFQHAPWIQLIGGCILVLILWISRKGRHALGHYSKDEAGDAVVMIGGGLLLAGYLPGEQLHAILQSFESLRTHAQTRQIGSGLYLPLMRKYAINDMSWYWFLSLIHGTALIGGGLFIIGWLVFNLRTLAAGVHYAFVPHPAAAPISDALRAGWQRPIDGPAVGRALRQTPDPAVASPPAFVSQVKAKQAEELRQRLEEEAKLIEAIKNRENARAEAEYWSKQVNEHERQRRR